MPTTDSCPLSPHSMAAIELRQKALGGYRTLLRARKVPFSGDVLAMTESAKELRRQFEAHRAEKDADTIKELLRGVRQAEEMLLYHIAQGKKNSKGNFEVKISPEQAGHMKTHDEIIHVDPENIPPKQKPLIETVPASKSSSG